MGGIRAEEPTGAGPQEEVTPTSAAGPSSRPHNLDLNRDLSTWEATKELVRDLASIEKQADQLFEQADSSVEEHSALMRDLDQVKKLLADTELRLEQVWELEKETQRAKAEESARLRADPLVQKALELEAAAKRARDALLSRYPRGALSQYERDRAKAKRQQEGQEPD